MAPRETDPVAAGEGRCGEADPTGGRESPVRIDGPRGGELGFLFIF
jgi:hypothetical protein